MIILSPLLLIFLIISIDMPSVKKSFKFLIKEGYVYRKDKTYKYYVKGDITFRLIEDQTYMVKIGNDDYENIYDINIGSVIERERLKSILIEYQNAHPVDKQRGDTVDTLNTHAGFIKHHLIDIERLVEKEI